MSLLILSFSVLLESKLYCFAVIVGEIFAMRKVIGRFGGGHMFHLYVVGSKKYVAAIPWNLRYPVK